MSYMRNLTHISFLKRPNIDRFFPGIIFVSDIVIYVYSILQFERFSEWEKFFLFYGLIFVLLYDWFLWGNKKFSWLQIIKFTLASLSSNYLAVEIQSFFLLSFNLFYLSVFQKGKKEDRIFTSVLMFLFDIFVLFRFYTQGLTNSFILIGENILFLFPLLVMRACNEISFFKNAPANKWQLFCQNKYEIPISLISWWFPFCLAYLLLFDLPFLCKALLGTTTLFCFFYDFSKIKKENETTVLSYILEKVYKFGVIILLLHTKEYYG